jgi:hypothetical protein
MTDDRFSFFKRKLVFISNSALTLRYQLKYSVTVLNCLAVKVVTKVNHVFGEATNICYCRQLVTFCGKKVYQYKSLLWCSVVYNIFLCNIQGGSNMTGTNCDLFTHKQSRSYLNHLVFKIGDYLSVIQRVSQEEMLISWEVMLSVILSKKNYMKHVSYCKTFPK